MIDPEIFSAKHDEVGSLQRNMLRGPISIFNTMKITGGVMELGKSTIATDRGFNTLRDDTFYSRTYKCLFIGFCG